MKRQGIVQQSVTVEIGQHPKDSITVHYIGCAGFFITKGDNTILIDPYFSYKAFFRTRLISEKHFISSRLSNAIDSTFTRAIGKKNDDAAVDALLIGHSHLDHLGDVPYLYNHHYLNSKVKVIGSTTTGQYLRGNGITAANIIDNIEASAASGQSNGRWVSINKNIRILPILSEHAPHARFFGINISLASDKEREKRDIKYRFPPRYGTGQTLSYLIDFLNDDSSVNFRIYHSSAGANSPYGFPPAEELTKHRIDLEILCAASFNQVDYYPEELVSRLNPRHILLSHWEDFTFRSYTRIKEHPHANPFYNYRNFFSRFNQLMYEINTGSTGDEINYTLPNVDTRIMFYY